MVADLAAAFADDPVMRWVFPRAAVRRRDAPHFFRMQARRLLPMGISTRTDGAAALWATHGQWREPPLHAARLALRCAPGAGRRGPLVAWGLGGVEAAHPAEPHAYLCSIGVRPGSTGRGLGGRMLAAGLATVDARGWAAYLESSNPRNVSLYERHGFVVTAEHRLPRGPVVRLMWRPARDQATTSTVSSVGSPQ